MSVSTLECRWREKVRGPWSDPAVGADDCWLWAGGWLSLHGYGRLYVGGKNQSKQAHIVAYELRNGPVPAGLVVMHGCDVRLCCNPAHLSVGTPQQNTWDMIGKGRWSGCVARGYLDYLERCEIDRELDAIIAAA